MAPPSAVCVIGAAGRMGQRVARLLLDSAELRLAGALGIAGDPQLGRDIATLFGRPPCGVQLTSDARAVLAGIDVAIDFSAPAAAARLAPLCAAQGVAYVVGSTGLSEADRQALNAAAEQVPVLAAANFSIGVNVLLELVRTAAARLGPGADIEIVETHHRKKRDAPSGTALALADAARAARPELANTLGRAGEHLRSSGELGIAALRGGDVPGEHTVFLFGADERLELTHRAASPDIFAQGALRAAAWLRGRAPGTYSMAQVLGAA